MASELKGDDEAAPLWPSYSLLGLEGTLAVHPNSTPNFNSKKYVRCLANQLPQKFKTDAARFVYDDDDDYVPPFKP